MIPVILSGGSGTRLWPVSREKYPKQFCDLFEESLQTMTLRRLAHWGQPWIITGIQLQDFTEKKAREAGVKPELVVFEPEAKNTAPAVALACRIAEIKGLQNKVMGVFPADHLIEKAEDFREALELAAEGAAQGRIVTIGLKPTTPETGYGYIQTQPAPFNYNSHLTTFEVVRFHEKPTRDVAVKFLQEGSFFWNAGIFIFTVEKMIQLFKNFQPAIWAAVSELKSDASNIKDVYKRLPSISVDYAILEKLTSKDLLCVPCNPGWSDVGSWDAVAGVYEKSGKAKIRSFDLDAKNNFILPLRDKTYAVVGVDDTIVIDTEDALLLVKRGHSQDVKTIVERIKRERPVLAKGHVFEERPWGKFEVLRDESHYKSKIISVNPGAQISYQSHNKREEHWVVVKGTGEVILDDKTIPVKTGTYIKIPLAARHRVRNTGTEMMQFIEVQLGTYFGEDDIVRYTDDYGRI